MRWRSWVTLITASHLRVRHETGASAAILTIGALSTGTVLVTFALTTLVDEPATLVLLVVIVGLSAIGDVFWKRSRGPRVASPALEEEHPGPG